MAIGDPSCSNCGYDLTGLVDSSRCPECGRPLVEVLVRERHPQRSIRYETPTRLFGLPLVSIAFGPTPTERFGTARGIVAVGDTAIGWFAAGAFARGIIAIGSLAVGVVAIGGLSLGLVSAAGMAIGGFAMGGAAIGAIARGGGAVGIVAQGGGAAGYYVEAGGGWGTHVKAANRRDPEAVNFFQWFNAYFGAGPSSGLRWFIAQAFLIIAVVLVVSTLLGLILLAAWLQRAPPIEPE